ncbi:MAG: hypothetical protein KF791_15000 [Verrucomicrobiae bacterium]|nr:hypothetical protein [Verrucomicrobiae bacterium]
MSVEPRPAVHASELLVRSLGKGRLGHAYLFAGDDSGVLEEAAMHLAQALTCTAGPEARPCGACPACRRTAGAGHPDVTWVRPGKKSRILSIDQIRELIQRVSLRPTEARHKVGVLVSAERLRVEAANAFLKTLEEPPRDSVFVLLTLDPDQVLETLRSRCLRLNFGSGSIRIEPDVARWLEGFAGAVTAASASLLDRYRLVESLLSELESTRSGIEETLTATSPLKRFTDADPAQRDRWEDELDAAVEAEYRRRRSQFLAGVHAWLRDIWVRTLSPEAPAFVPALTDATATVARRINPTDARGNLEAWERTSRLLLATNAQEALVMEVGLLRLKL